MSNLYPLRKFFHLHLLLVNLVRETHQLILCVRTRHLVVCTFLFRVAQRLLDIKHQQFNKQFFLSQVENGATTLNHAQFTNLSVCKPVCLV